MASRPGRRQCPGTGKVGFLQVRTDGIRVTCLVCGRDNLIAEQTPDRGLLVPRHWVRKEA